MSWNRKLCNPLRCSEDETLVKEDLGKYSVLTLLQLDNCDLDKNDVQNYNHGQNCCLLN